MRLRRARTFACLIAVSAPAAAGATAPFCATVVEEYGGTLASIDAGGTILRRLRVGDRPHEVILSPTGRYAYVTLFGIADYDHRIGEPGTSVNKIDLRTGRLVRRFGLPKGLLGPHGVALRPQVPRELFVNAEVGGDTMVVFDEKRGHVLRRFPIQKGAHHFTFSANGRSLYVFSGSGLVDRYDPRSGKRLARTNIGLPVRALRFSSAGRVLASAKGYVVVLSADTLAEIGRLRSPVQGQLLYLDEWPDGTVVAPSLQDGGVVVFAPRSAPTFIPTGKTPVHVVRAPNGLAYVTNVDDEHISIVDPKSGRTQSLGPFKGANGLALGGCPTTVTRL